GEVFDDISRGTELEIFSVYGGVEQDAQIKKLEEGIDILIATPGRMFDLVSQGYIRLHRVNTLVLDEADHMLDLGFIKDIRDVLRFIPKHHQTLFFSATINKEIKKVAYSLVSKPIRIQVSPKNPVAKTVEHSVGFISMDDKRFFLEYLLKEESYKKVLVFVRTKVRAERVLKAMERVGIKAETIHGEKSQDDRFNIMKGFKEAERAVLIATDVSARGVDIPNVELVINYDMPDKPENYVHRCGRTGRGNQKGVAIAFCSEQEEPILGDIEVYLGKKIEVLEINQSSYKNVVDSSIDHAFGWKKLMNSNKDLDFFEGTKKKKDSKKKRAK
ncbi:DEAD/DEAH box helicase, partial [Cyclobacteriaceae bacterium]|nr:DEAD/DEAH box helicase [Cyclobacteriaceae bacterium]